MDMNKEKSVRVDLIKQLLEHSSQNLLRLILTNSARVIE